MAATPILSERIDGAYTILSGMNELMVVGVCTMSLSGIISICSLYRSGSMWHVAAMLALVAGVLLFACGMGLSRW